MLTSFFSKPLAPGTTAPDFSAPDDTGKRVTLSDLRRRNVVLVFYPGDDTPGCTKQLCDFRDRWEALREKGILVYGVNPQSAAKHTRFRNKFSFPFPLIVDEDRAIAKLYNCDGLVITRTVYLIGPDGTIRFARRGMPSPSEVAQAAE